MVSSEASPYAKTGGLADVLGALPPALVAAGEEVAVILPFYRRTAVANPTTVYRDLQIGGGAYSFRATILEEVRLGVRYLFVQIPELYDHEGLYDEGGPGKPGNDVRFAALCHAALGVARHLFAPEVIHCHDWQAGLLPLLLKEVFNHHPAYLGIKSVLTIHNLGYQGFFPRGALRTLGLPERLFQPNLIEFYGGISFLKAGIVYADALTTVSPRYAKEIQTPAFGFGLDGLLRARRSVLSGILNGADYTAWNPAADQAIPAPFDAGHLEGKSACKKALLAEAGLPEANAGKPVIGIVSRFAAQKGFDLLMRIPHELAALDASFVILGSGERELEDFFAWFASVYPSKVSVRIGYDDGLAHRI
jgi:starch synthase